MASIDRTAVWFKRCISKPMDVHFTLDEDDQDAEAA